MPSSADQERFIELIEKHQRLLMKVCWAYTRTSHDRDDLLQEIIGRLWAGFPNYDPNRMFSTWVYRVALHVAIDACRRRPSTATVPLNDAHVPPAPHLN